jgi:uncharacterized flavoprotein (TIGR03862 family)
MSQTIPSEIAVIGGGPAGLMAAEAASSEGRRVTVYDHMPSLGRKLLMAGRGGLNLTHSESVDAMLRRYGPAAPRLDPFLTSFPPATLIAWCEALGEPTFVGSSGRVFPRSLKASPLLRAWLARLARCGVRAAPRHRWTGWTAAGVLSFATPEGPIEVAPSATVLACGGASWPRLGSDGAWTTAMTGIEIRDLRPSNCGFTVDWSHRFRGRFEGEPLKRIAVTFGGRTVRGEATITAEGIEGGAIYALSGAIRDACPATVTLDLRPDLDLATLRSRVGGPRGGQSLSTFLRKTAGLAPVAIGLVQEALHATPPPTDDLASLIKSVPLMLMAPTDIARAISTAGGVAWSEVDDNLMLLRRPGVFVAGEMLDWEAPTGGYLLQACFSTGEAAGQAASAWLQRKAA